MATRTLFGMSLLIAACSLAASCDVGDDDGGDGGDGTTDGDEEKSVCTATLAMTGTFTAAGTLDPAGGCQPAGTWSVNVAVTDMGTCTTVPVMPNYQYTVTATPQGATSGITYSGDSTDVRLQISASGGGECTASFEHITGGGTMFNEIDLHPRIPEPTSGGTTLTISGDGEYNLWTKHP